MKCDVDSILFNTIRGAEKLPAAAIIDTVNEALITHDTLIITAPPGAGKSTLLPLTILQGLVKDAPLEKLNRGAILMLEPRRLAARQIAERMASMLEQEVGHTIGYRVRMESHVSDTTQIEVFTEGILTRRLTDDPTLEGVQVVIFDEFHERNIHSDEALALTREIQQLLRPDLKIIIMSATIDATTLAQQLHAEVISCDGHMYPIETIRTSTPSLLQASVNEIADAVCHIIRQAHHDHEGDILAFLPGEAEIRRCAELLEDSLGTTHIYPLYALLPPQEQQRAIAPSRFGERKVVLSTPIAETSLTIEGVRVVVDSGLCRKLEINQQTGLSRLTTTQISLDMADQRRGRAGRVAPGVCYRLWSLATEHRMEANRQPEILNADLASLVLDIAAWGESHPERLQWLTPPPVAHIAQASRLLQLLGAVEANGQITTHGKVLSQLPCHPRIAQMLTLGYSLGQLGLAADIAALLEEKDPLAATESSADLQLRIEALNQARRSSHHPKSWERIISLSQQYQRVRLPSISTTQKASKATIGRLIASAYPERIAQAMPEGCGRFRLASGDTAMVDTNDYLSSHDWLAVASLNTQPGSIGRIFLAVPLDRSDLQPFILHRDNVSFDSKRGQMQARQESRIGALLIESRPLATSDTKLRNAVIDVLCEAAVKDGASMFDFNDSLGNLQRRITAVSAWHPELELPDVTTEQFLSRSDEWLPFCLADFHNLAGISTAELRKIDLTSALWSLLSYDQQQAIDRLAPTHITVPTGSRIRVEYRLGAECPILRVRLQECFGLADTPRIDNGRQPVLIELLSPGFKPVQLTQDLRSFWQSTYFEVRKELRRRYPKHFWPDNPLEAEAVRGVKRK